MDIQSLPKSQKVVASTIIDLFGSNREKREFALQALAFAFEGQVGLAKQKLKTHFGRREQADIRTICHSEFVAI